MATSPGPGMGVGTSARVRTPASPKRGTVTARMDNGPLLWIRMRAPSARLGGGGDRVLNEIDLPAPTPTSRHHPGHKGGRGAPGELVKVTDQMRLIGIASLTSDPAPIQPPPHLVQPPPHPLKADQPSRRLGPQPNLLTEPGDQVLVAPTDLTGQPTDRHRPPRGHQPLPDPGDLGRGPRPTLQPPQQEPVHQPKAPPPARGLAELLTQAPAVGPRHLDQVHQLAAELGHGQPRSRQAPNGDSTTSR